MPAAAPSGHHVAVIYIVAFCLLGFVVFALFSWFGFHLYRKRTARQRHENLGAAFLSVRGLVKDLEKESYSPLSPPSTFPRNNNNINAEIVTPSKALIMTTEEQLCAERGFVLTRHQQNNSIPKAFSPLPNDRHTPVFVRDSPSRAFSSRNSHFSVFSSTSSYNESVTEAGDIGNYGRSIRKVRQTFNPVLPDELFISVGEQLMILQSFDDGWCVVGRESGLLMPQPKSLFGGSRPRAQTPTIFGHNIGAGVGTTSGGNVELGMVPAWTFLKPVKGLRAERPMRRTSLGVTVQMDAPPNQRNDTISWSNF